MKNVNTTEIKFVDINLTVAFRWYEDDYQDMRQGKPGRYSEIVGVYVDGKDIDIYNLLSDAILNKLNDEIESRE